MEEDREPRRARQWDKFPTLIPHENRVYQQHFRLDSEMHLQIHDHGAAARDSFTNNSFGCAFSA